MTRFLALPFVLSVGLLAVSATGAAKLKVVTTIPDLADMTRQIGGDQVDVTSLATGVEDIHAVPMKPSFAVRLNRADAVVLLGLEAEHAFLPALLEAARNPKILRDAPGYIDCSTYIAERFGMEPVGTIEIRAGVDPTPGHIADLEERMRREKVDLVVRELHYPAGLAETVARATGAKLVELPVMVGGVPEAKDYISFIDYDLQTMLKAVKGS